MIDKLKKYSNVVNEKVQSALIGEMEEKKFSYFFENFTYFYQKVEEYMGALKNVLGGFNLFKEKTNELEKALNVLE